MLYAMNKWKRMVLICLWPYAMRPANAVTSTTPRKGEDQSPLECFSGVNITPKLRHFHGFGCPTYILDNALQSGQGSPKWKRHSRLGVYLGPSPSHARSVALVLNPRNGHVSPQFHVKFDDFFETVRDKSTDMDTPDPDWKYLSGFAVKKDRPEPAGRGIAKRLDCPETRVHHDGPSVIHDSKLGHARQSARRTNDPGCNGTTDNQQEDPPSENRPAAICLAYRQHKMYCLPAGHAVIGSLEIRRATTRA